MSRPINYPPEILDAVVTMNNAAKALDQLMDDLQRLVNGLVGASKGAAVAAFGEVQELWRRSGLSHNQALAGVAKAAGDSYDEMTAFDAYLANQLNG
jgi:uncharacterized protein YukE